MKKAPAPAPPRQKKEISEELVAIVKRKVSAPMGARPAGLMPFKGPKKYEEEVEKENKKSKNETGDEDWEDVSCDDDDVRPSKKDGKSKVSEGSRNRRAGRSRSSSDESKDKNSDYDDDDNDNRDNRKKSKQVKNRRPRKDYDVSEDEEDDISVEESSRGTRRERQSNDFNKSKDQSGKQPYKKSSQASREMTSSRGSGSGRGRDRGKDRDRDEYNSRSLRDDERLDGPDEESEAQTYGNRNPPRPYSAPSPNPTVSSLSQSVNRMSLTGVPNRETMSVASKSGVFNFKPILHSTYRELRNFVMTPPPVGMVVRCYIEREKTIAPFYSLCADLEDGTGRELIVCKKVLRSFSSHYVFSLKSEDLYRKREQRSRLYLGKLRATSGSEYVMFDNGVMDKGEDDGEGDNGDDDSNDGGEAKDGRDDTSLYRQQMAVIHYNTKTRPVPENIRGMEVCVPQPSVSPRNDGDTPMGQPAQSTKAPNLQAPFQQIRDSGRQNELMANKYFVLHEKQSKYDPLSSCLVDFKGRANIASVKNFQLVESQPETGAGSVISARLRGLQTEEQNQVILLQMGKATEHCFNLDFRAPLTMLQAFGIAIARFDAKLKG